jgi:hypothetical protein
MCAMVTGRNVWILRTAMGPSYINRVSAYCAPLQQNFSTQTDDRVILYFRGDDTPALKKVKGGWEFACCEQQMRLGLGKKAPILLAIAGLSTSTALAGEPTGTLILQCKGVVTFEGVTADDGKDAQPASRGVIVDFRGKTVSGLDGSTALPIYGIDETIVRFRFRKPGAFKEGMLDRITGSLTARFLTTDTNTDKTMWSEAYDLQCKPTQRSQPS